MKHSENHLHQNISKWFAIYTYYKREKIAAHQLINSKIETFLPLQKVTKRYGRKVKKSEVPLINHYLFVKIKKEEYIKVLQCPYVLNFVKFSENLISIPEKEINLLKRILGGTVPIEIGKEPIQEGDKVEVIGGNLTGLQGTLINKQNNQYLCIRLESIDVSIIVSIATHLVRKVKQDHILQHNIA